MKPLVLLAFLIASIVGVAGQVQFKASTSIVRLEVNVADDRGHVSGLIASDFVLEDKGAQRQVRVEEFSDTALDLVLVAPPLSAFEFVAADQSVRFSNGVTAFLDHVQDRDRLGVVLAATTPKRLRSLTPGRGAFGLEALAALKDDYSASFDAIALGLRVFEASDRRQALVAFTNAADFRSVVSAKTAAELAGGLGPAFIVAATPVTIRRSVSAVAEMRGGGPIGDPVVSTVSGSVLSLAVERLVGRSGGSVLNLGQADPTLLMQRLFKSLRTGYLLTYDLPTAKGWHPVKVKVNRRGARVTVREGYFVD